MFPAIETIHTFVAPVVMISAAGLLCLAFYHRLGAVVSRARELNRERFELIARLSAGAAGDEPCSEAAHLKRRVEMLDELGHQLFDRARWLRNSLLCLLFSVLAMLCCSLALGLSSLGSALAWAALASFIVGTLAMMLGVIQAIWELGLALEPLQLEHERLESRTPHAPREARHAERDDYENP